MTDATGSEQPNKTGNGYEKRDVKVGAAFAVGGVVVLIIAIMVVTLNDVFVLDKEEMMYSASLAPESTALRELRDKETETLTTYKSLDPTKGFYRIPIARAMELLANEAYQEQSSPHEVK
jgi:hypothetical protein